MASPGHVSAHDPNRPEQGILSPRGRVKGQRDSLGLELESIGALGHRKENKVDVHVA